MGGRVGRGVCKQLEEAAGGSQREASRGRKGLEGAGPTGPRTSAPPLVILVCYSENNGKTSCFGEILPAVSWRMN